MADELVVADAFRVARPDEAAFIAALINSAYRGESSRAGWTTEADLLEGLRTDEAEVRELIEREDSVMLLCERGGTIVGCVHLQREGSGAYLGMLVVRPDLQAGGVGKEFLRAAENFVRDRWDTATMRMTVISRRAELIAFYERRGYRRTGRMRPFPAEALSASRVGPLEFEDLEKDLR